LFSPSDDFHLDAERRPALLDLASEDLVGSRAGGHRLDRSTEPSGLISVIAPGVAHFDA